MSLVQPALSILSYNTYGGIKIRNSGLDQYGAQRFGRLIFATIKTRGSAIAEEPRDALRQLKYYGRFLTELLTRSSANPEEPCEHTVI